MEKILCPTIHVHRQHDCSYVDVGTVCNTVSRSMFVYTYFLRASLVNVCPLDEDPPVITLSDTILTRKEVMAPTTAQFLERMVKHDDKNDGEEGRERRQIVDIVIANTGRGHHRETWIFHIQSHFLFYCHTIFFPISQ